ncbi:MFS transporter [Novosphingobium sediminicola]|uniref:Na+/melibiose symporter-like transporter n=1 Tax=Novosphingobium sediminicola TaxID=563162 RepID=A0A7W6CMA4_9SPHN|nr:MFS transporter [Novosphingobium sediminicola]MBB3957274.1 Na+/melibiose symporter-like transporter [Novosphingobium sediminicola]
MSSVDPIRQNDRDAPYTPTASIAAYLLAHGGKTLFWTISDLYFVFYLNQICGIAPAITGLIVGLSILLAALADAFAGTMLQAIVIRPGQIIRLQLIGGIGNGLLLLLFALTAFVDTNWRVACAVATLMGLRLFYALIDIPQNALLSWAQWSDRGIATVVAGRNIVGGMARMMLALAFVPIMTGAPSGQSPARFLALVCAISIIQITGVALLARHLPDAQPDIPAAEGQDGAQPWLHFARMGLVSLMITGFTQLEPYLVSRVIAQGFAATTFLTSVSLGGTIGQPFWRWRSMQAPHPRLRLRLRLQGEIMISGIIAGIALVLAPLHQPVGSGVAGLLCGLVSGGCLFLLWTDLAANTRRKDAFSTFGGFTASAKLGQGLAIMAMGAWLQGYLAPILPGDAASIRPIAGILLIMAAGALILVHHDVQSHRRHRLEKAS